MSTAGVSISARSIFRALGSTPSWLALTGGYNAASRFVSELPPVPTSGPATPPVAPQAPASAATPTPPAAAVDGGRVVTARDLVATTRGGAATSSGIGLDTPVGRIAITGGDYRFGTSRYPIASVKGIATSFGLAVAVLAGVVALLGLLALSGALGRRHRATQTPLPPVDEGWDIS